MNTTRYSLLSELKLIIHFLFFILLINLIIFIFHRLYSSLVQEEYKR